MTCYLPGGRCADILANFIMATRFMYDGDMLCFSNNDAALWKVGFFAVISSKLRS